MFRRIVCASVQMPCRRGVVIGPPKPTEKAWHLAARINTFDSKGQSAARNKFFILLPIVIGLYVNTYHLHPHPVERWEYKEYPHIYTRRRPMPFGDGVRGLFHDPVVNAVIGEGYEKDLPKGGKEYDGISDF